jgi:phage N-6-adenine-methyltransferase
VTNNAKAFQEYQTPPDLFAELDEEFHFTLDAAASHENALCERYFTEEEDGLSRSWAEEVVFCNPPYARWQLFRWVRKAYLETGAWNTTVVMLIPTSVETEWFHTYVWDTEAQRARDGVEVRFLKGRPRFIDPRNKAKSYKGWRPLTAVMVVVFRSRVECGHSPSNEADCRCEGRVFI